MSTNQVWIEVSLLEHWGPKPHGIPRVTQNIFLQSLRRDDVRYFYYHRTEESFIAIRDVAYFKRLAAGDEPFNADRCPAGHPLTSQLAEGDRIFFCEVGWDHAPYYGCMAELRREHPRTIFEYLVHDLIPITSPMFFEQEFGNRAAQFLRLLPTVVDRYVCVSDSTARDVRSILAPRAETVVMKSGNDMGQTGVAPDIDRPYVLSVGTIEIRKNHLLLYYVWRKLAADLGERCPKLVLVGRAGWLASDLVYLLSHDPLVRDLIEIRHGITDERLVGLLKGSMFTAFPSHAEGWGLPASESLFYGKVCVTSNNTSLPEINPFPALMFDSYDTGQAYRVIRGLIDDPERLKAYEAQIPQRFERQTWEKSFDELFGLIEA
ncbi:glycosyltransferase family 4 protein [Paraburkholderia sp. BR13439]|uniref:glycosyltransferase family 4 protein n=1 Tax=Paraburkholderia sp. BR13439 TaxID=3236996 RepID=UPI0034CE0264